MAESPRRTTASGPLAVPCMAGDSGGPFLCWPDTMVRTKIEMQSEHLDSAFLIKAHMHYIHCGQVLCARIWRRMLGDQSPKGEIQLVRMHRGACQQTGRPQLQAVKHKTAGGTQSQAPLAKLSYLTTNTLTATNLPIGGGQLQLPLGQQQHTPVQHRHTKFSSMGMESKSLC